MSPLDWIKRKVVATATLACINSVRFRNKMIEWRTFCYWKTLGKPSKVLSTRFFTVLKISDFVLKKHLREVLYSELKQFILSWAIPQSLLIIDNNWNHWLQPDLKLKHSIENKCIFHPKIAKFRFLEVPSNFDRGGMILKVLFHYLTSLPIVISDVFKDKEQKSQWGLNHHED